MADWKESEPGRWVELESGYSVERTTTGRFTIKNELGNVVSSGLSVEGLRAKIALINKGVELEPEHGIGLGFGGSAQAAILSEILQQQRIPSLGKIKETPITSSEEYERVLKEEWEAGRKSRPRPGVRKPIDVGYRVVE